MYLFAFFPILKKARRFYKNIGWPFFKIGKEKQKPGKEKQGQGKKRNPWIFSFPILRKLDRKSKLKAGQGRMSNILVNFCMEPRSIIEPKKKHFYILF